MNQEFDEYNRQGLQQAIIRTEERLKSEYLYGRELPSWERIEEKIPGIRDQIIDVIEEAKKGE
jgi:hypothetical protein